MQSRRFFRSSLVALCATTPLITVLSAVAVTETPYQGIVARNVFALKPPPPPPSLEATKPPPPKIWLTGITTILGNKRALLKTPAPPGKPGEPTKGEQYYILTEGQREGDIEVLQIDENAGTVKVDNGGTIFTLNFEKDGQKLASGPAAGPPPAIPPPTGINPASHTITPTTSGGFNMPTRPLRAGPGSAAVPPTGGFGSPATGAGLGYGYDGSATSAGATTPAAAQAAALQQAAQRTPEENVALYEANRLKNEALIQSGVRLPPMPRHVYLGGPQQQQPAQPAPQTPSMPFAPGIQPVPQGQ